jgi:hypothetical protein
VKDNTAIFPQSLDELIRDGDGAAWRMIEEDNVLLKIASLRDCDGIAFNLLNDDGDGNAFVWGHIRYAPIAIAEKSRSLLSKTS